MTTDAIQQPAPPSAPDVTQYTARIESLTQETARLAGESKAAFEARDKAKTEYRETVAAILGRDVDWSYEDGNEIRRVVREKLNGGAPAKGDTVSRTQFDAATKKYEGELAALRTAIADKDRVYATSATKAQMLGALDRHPLIDGAREQVADLLLGRGLIAYNAERGTVEPVPDALKAAGLPLLEGANPIGLDGLVKVYLESNRHFLKAGVGGSGTGAGSPSGVALTREAYARMSEAERAKALAGMKPEDKAAFHNALGVPTRGKVW